MGDEFRNTPFGMLAHSRNRKQLRPEVESSLETTYRESLNQMADRMDIVCVDCPHALSTFHLMNARQLRLMKPSVEIASASRGEAVDLNASTRMLRDGETPAQTSSCSTAGLG